MKPRLRAWLVPYGPFVTFPQRTPQSGKVRCSVCGASGYDTSWNGAVAGWQKTHLRGPQALRPLRSNDGRPARRLDSRPHEVPVMRYEPTEKFKVWKSIRTGQWCVSISTYPMNYPAYFATWREAMDYATGDR